MPDTPTGRTDGARMQKVSGPFGLALISCVALLTLTACASSSSGSRHALYESIDELAADSSVVVVGTAGAQHADGSTTVSSVEVTNVPANPQLGANLEAGTSSVSVGEVVAVRQEGDSVLSSGEEYLLFLTSSMLPGDAAAQYFVTGAVAGIYQRDGDVFRRVELDSGDQLPETITIADAADE